MQISQTIFQSHYIFFLNFSHLKSMKPVLYSLMNSFWRYAQMNVMKFPRILGNYDSDNKNFRFILICCAMNLKKW